MDALEIFQITQEAASISSEANAYPVVFDVELIENEKVKSLVKSYMNLEINIFGLVKALEPKAESFAYDMVENEVSLVLDLSRNDLYHNAASVMSSFADKAVDGLISVDQAVSKSILALSK